ncbi:MAG TPA: tetratricopeptide repeat protein [Streptosporangiaceae bacterium]
MTIVLLIAGLAFAVGLLVLRPFAAAAPARPAVRPSGRVPGPAEDQRRELLRQLRDLDDDLAAGKLSGDDHARLRGPVERAAAAVLTGTAKDSAAKDRAVKASATKASAAKTSAAAASAAADGAKEPAGAVAVAAPAAPPPGSGGARATRRWRRRSAILLVAAGAAAAVTVLLEHAVAPRTAGETISGTAVAGAAPAAGGGMSGQAGTGNQGNPGSPGTASGTNGAGGPASPASSPGAPPGRKPPTRQQLMAVAEAEAVVQQNPKSVAAHLALASAYVAAGASQLAAVEWLAVTQLDPGNAEANTDLALLAFEAGQARQARTMVDKALASNPEYPEGLYVRGLIDLMGLREPAAAVRDLNAYLAAAPYGSHRTDAVTLIALAQAQEHP